MKAKFLTLLAVAAFFNFNVQAQNVGVGEPNPNSKLSVKGNLSVGANYSSVAAPTGGLIVEGPVGLGTSAPNANAVLDMGSSGKGMIMPRMTKAQRLALTNPVQGMLVFDADSNTVYFHDGTKWLNFPAVDAVHNTVTNITGANGTSLLASGGVAGPTGATGQGYGANSTTSTSIGTGPHTINIQTGQAWQTDDNVRLTYNSGNYMEGTVTSYAGGTLTVNVNNAVGSGTYSEWSVSLIGEKGATGPTGPAGAKGATGATGPAGAAGANGATGPTGADGATGSNGATWLTGSGAPSGGLGSVNDFYLRSSNGTYYKKTGSSTWTSQGSLKGAAGAAGATGPTGAAGSNGTNGTNGATGATGPAGPNGATGATGPAGTNGTNGANGATGPTGANGATGATGPTGAAGIGVNGATGPTGPTGSAGANGTNGTNGATWYTGSGTPSSGIGIVNDLYINSSNGTYYKKTGASTWTSQGSLKGVTGSAGANGATGATGPTGAAGIGTNGATGPTGAAGTAGSTGPTGPTGATGPAGTAGWGTTGNSASASDFLGTTNSQSLKIKVGNNETAYFGVSDYNVVLGQNPSYGGGGTYNVGIGYDVSTYGSYSNSVAIGRSSEVQASNGTAIGYNANVNQQYGMAIGNSAQAQGNSAMVIGKSAYSNSTNGIAIGTSAQSQGTSAVVIGKSAYSNTTDGIAFGTSAQSQGAQAIAIGLSAYASGTSSIAIGGGSSTTQAQGTYSISLGYNAYSSQQDAIAIGDHAQAQGTNSIALGTNLYNGNSNTVAIGNSSVTTVNLNGASSTSYALVVGNSSSNGNGAYLTKGGTWTNASDRNLKEDFSALDLATILAKVSALDITKWKYKGTNEYHIGPMAQDFYSLFSVGEDDKRISSIDPSGVALAAIKALNTKVDEQQKVIEELLVELKSLKSK